jgi:hypothetical protein
MTKLTMPLFHEIQQFYANIFNGEATVYVEYYDYSIHQSGNMFCAVGRERGFFQQNDEKINLTIRTSRIYQMQGDRWKQTHHHGSIEDSKLLAAYQKAVFKK